MDDYNPEAYAQEMTDALTDDLDDKAVRAAELSDRYARHYAKDIVEKVLPACKRACPVEKSQGFLYTGSIRKFLLLIRTLYDHVKKQLPAGVTFADLASYRRGRSPEEGGEADILRALDEIEYYITQGGVPQELIQQIGEPLPYLLAMRKCKNVRFPSLLYGIRERTPWQWYGDLWTGVLIEYDTDHAGGNKDRYGCRVTPQKWESRKYGNFAYGERCQKLVSLTESTDCTFEGPMIFLRRELELTRNQMEGRHCFFHKKDFGVNEGAAVDYERGIYSALDCRKKCVENEKHYNSLGEEQKRNNPNLKPCKFFTWLGGPNPTCYLKSDEVKLRELKPRDIAVSGPSTCVTCTDSLDDSIACTDGTNTCTAAEFKKSGVCPPA